MPRSHGSFVWHELMTSDIDAAQAFYEKAVGWTGKSAGMTGMDYRIFSAGETMVAGLMSIPEEAAKMGVPPNWTGYVGVADVDASTAKIKALGGKVYKEPTDIPGVGRFSVVADPQGAVFQLFKTVTEPESYPAPDTPGLVGWNELYAVDIEKVFPFYAEICGWKKLDAIDMGPMGTYQIYGNADQALGGMMNKPAHMPVACWLFYVNTADVDAALARVAGAKGKLVNGPMQVPGGHWIAQATDPQGAFFAVVGQRPNAA